MIARRSAVLSLTVLLAAGASPAGSQQVPPLRVGLIYAYTGAPEFVGKGVDAGVAAYLALHGDTVAGRKVIIIKRDDTGFAPDVARRVAQELVVQENVDILIGGTSTPTGAAIAQISTAAKKPFFAINVGTSNVFKSAPYSVRFGYTIQQITKPLADWAFRSGAKTAYLLSQDYAPGVDSDSEFRKGFTGAGGSVLGEALVPLNSQDYSAYVQKVHDAGAQVLFAFFNYLGGPAMLKTAQNTGLLRATKVLSPTSIVPDSQVALSDPTISLGLISSQNYSYTHDSPLNRAFVAAYQTAYGSTDEVPTFDACAAFDILGAIYTIAQQLHGNLDPDKTIEAVRGMHFESPRGPVVIDPQSRAAVENVYIRRIERRNGRLVPVEIAAYPMVRDPNEP